ncbi:acetyltransferase [Desulfogranum mediterraneum]|uniref:acetyltransferase n=1 Tax=Desulfogranum mediterraneum TaxID=160661 RepID=UPI00048A6BC6|nr:acetyltransferase [Desulfogranum mediterraneum]
MRKNSVYIFGASGHGKVVAGALISAGYTVCGFFDDDVVLHGRKFFGEPVLGGQEDFAVLEAPVAVMGIGNGRIRRMIMERFSLVQWLSVIHRTAWVDPAVTVGGGTVIFAGAVVQPDSRIGKHCIINTGATVDHDCVVGDYAHICPGVNLAGNVTVGAGAWVGIGSQVIQGVTIGAHAVVGAGATVTRDVPEGVTVVGTPAKPNRTE